MLVLSCLLPLGVWADTVVIEINETNFPNAKFRTYLLSTSYGNDGLLTEEELANVTEMNVSEKGIASLKGIEYFTALTYLDCSCNNLTELDVSKNTKLTTLYCYCNKIKGAQMDALIASMPTVENGDFYVMDFGIDEVLSRGLSQHHEGKVTSDFIDTPYEEYNMCTGSQVEAAKAKGWTVWYHGYTMGILGWYKYGVSDDYGIAINNTNFPDANFRKYLFSTSYGNDGFLTEEDLANVTEMNVASKGIASLKGIEYFTALTSLDCSRNNLTDLDVSKNTKLTTLKCYHNKIRGAKMDALIASMPIVENGDFYVVNFYDDDESLARGLSQHHEGKVTSDFEDIPYTEQNECTKLQATAAKAKGWTVWCYGFRVGSLGWYEYDIYYGLVINKTNFPDDNFRTYLLSKSYGNDGILTDEELANVTEMTVADKDIASLKGIEHFTALTYLDCSNNKLTELDVSKNTKLTTLRCFCNRIKGAQMDALIASMPIVENGDFYVLYWRDDSADPAPDDGELEYARGLGQLDEGKVTSDMNNLPTDYNECTKFQAAAAAAKGWTVWKYLVPLGGTAGYSKFDVSGIVAINEKNFPDDVFRSEVLNLPYGYGSDGLLTEEEIAAVTWFNIFHMGFKSLKGIEYFTALTDLYCEDNLLTDLDVSKNTALNYLRCERNQLTSLKLPEGTVLETLSCQSNQLTTIDVSKNPGLTRLDCGFNPLRTLDVSKNTKLTSLHCNDNQLTTLDVSNNPELEFLDCSGNKLTALDMSKNTKLTNLNCYQNRINGEQMTVLVNSLPTVEKGTFIVLTQPYEQDQNACTRPQVQIAKDKGWKVLHYFPEFGEYMEYDGSDADVSVAVGNALVAGFSSKNTLDFTGSDVSAWIATGFRGGNVMLSRVNKVPARTGLYLKATETGTFTVPVAYDKAYYANFFVGTPFGRTVQPTESVDGETYQTLSFALSKTTGKPAFFPNTETKEYGEGKMYLRLPAWALGDAARADERGGVTDTADEGLVTVTVSEVGAAGFSSDKNVDFTGITGISAWIATGFVDGNVLLSRVYAVPAGTGVYLKADNPGTAVTRNIPVTTERPCYANLFVGTGGTAVTVEPTEEVYGEEFHTLSFAKSKTTGKPAFFPNTETKEYAAGKMYLRLPEELLDLGSETTKEPGNEARTFGLVFCETECVDGNGEMANGTTDIRGRMTDGVTDQRGIYDLQGRKVLNRKPLNKKSLIISGGRVRY